MCRPLLVQSAQRQRVAELGSTTLELRIVGLKAVGRERTDGLSPKGWTPITDYRHSDNE
jgi:hypothetical protein